MLSQLEIKYISSAKALGLALLFLGLSFFSSVGFASDGPFDSTEDDVFLDAVNAESSEEATSVSRPAPVRTVTKKPLGVPVKPIGVPVSVSGPASRAIPSPPSRETEISSDSTKPPVSTFEAEEMPDQTQSVIAPLPAEDWDEAPIKEPEVIEESAAVVESEPSPVRAVPPVAPPKAVARPDEKKSEFPAQNFYAEEFFVSPDLRLQYEAIEIDGFVFIKTPSREYGTNYSIVTDFKGNVLKSRYVPGLITEPDIRDWIDKNLETADFEEIEIRRLTLKKTEDVEKGSYLYWVGQKSFSSADEAQSQIALVKSIAEAQGLNFNSMVQEANRYIRVPEQSAAIEIKSPAQFEKEESLALKWADHLNIGEDLFGPFQGVGTGEPIIWQSFGESTWRNTNLQSKHFNNVVGFWANRVVFKGIRFPINTVNPYLEAIVSLDGTATDFSSNLKLFAGVEWRPLERNAWLYNTRPWSLPLLIWMRNYRLYAQYGTRTNIKGEILDSDNHDMIWGVSIFYEFGVDPPPASEGAPTTIPDYLRNYVWGEYFGDYRVEHTNFSANDDFDAMILNSAITLGFKTPGIPLPQNPINDKLVLMPYVKLDHVNNTRYSFPFQNRYSFAVGVRWMPFSNYRYAENEWLSKVKIFGEYVGLGKVQHTREDQGEVPYAIREDFRFGINISSRRF